MRRTGALLPCPVICSPPTHVQLVVLEDFIAANVLEISIERNMDVRSLFQALIQDYNVRLKAVETDHSLTIELR
jgi:Domain of unknown function (DUF4928)